MLLSEVGGSVADAVAGCCTLFEDGGCPLCITGRAGIVDGIAPSIGGVAAAAAETARRGNVISRSE